MLNEAYTFFTPKEDLTPVEFNAKYTYISSEVSSYSGFFNPNFNRYLLEPLNAFDEPSINKITLMWGSQLGKSFLLTLGALFRIWKYNSNILYVLASDVQSKQLVRERFLPLMRKNKLITELLPDNEDLITLQNMQLKNCTLHFNGSGNASKLAGFSCPVVLGDEVEKWDSRSKKESGAISLSMQRIKSYSKAEQLFVLSSTPTIEEDNIENIYYHYKRSDQRKYYVECLECGEFAKIGFKENNEDFHIDFENAKFEDGSRNYNVACKSARLVCPHCNAKFDNNQKNQMVNSSSSFWRADNELADESSRGYQLNSIYSYYVTLGDAVKTFLEGKESINGLMNFNNGFMGMPFKNRIIKAPDLIQLKSLECEYVKGEKPRNTAFSLLIADVQKYHLYYMILSITSEGFIHIVENSKATGFEMLKAEKENYNCEYCLVDSRYQTSEVIANLAELGKDWIAVRAFEKLPNNAFHDIVLVDSVSGQRAKGGRVNKVNEFRINLEHYKSLFFRMRNQELPNLQIYKDFDNELAKHLLGEVQVEKMDRNGKRKIVFEALYPRIDYLDCCVYGLAFSYFLRGTRAYRHLNPEAEGTRKPLKDRIQKFNL
jgi:hypothetical protein